MTLQKFGAGEIIDDDQKPITKSAAKDDWTPSDDEALAAENAE